MEPIPDHMQKDLKVLFVGFNPSIRSSETGFHYANPTNRFWKILYEAGLTSRKYAPDENNELLELGYGLTNIVDRPTKEAAEISKTEYAEGAAILQRKIKMYQPKAVCFVGKGVYQEYSKKRSIQWGVQENPVVPDTIEYVCPSSSGLVRMKLDDIVEIYKGLKKFI
ncbi:G/U mismatch-specific DNA glycosylase [Planococcus liqunii]|uniref:G/U mismatch-specific DNA glycosylase n=1 Tax=Planococcus liqunii TaxID=3058394 RepID=A0ABT8MR97_9BACL|nr:MULTISPECIES: G/U mismatch-specific DNA glycosylase [unclassified Planococcus (in: firmicutes)]MDN7227442.1 G/U mismatch-specific DNA glycosylase [Planococcus sp. N064]WKA52896.1 G/U mismatch-specific DNA glycosylase [Planococcus sp. N056]